MNYQFYSDCVSWPRHDVDDGLIPMVDNAIDITYRTFRKNVGGLLTDTLAANLGYDRDLHISQDYAVSFHRSKLHGHRVYYVRWSSIEHVFVPENYSREEQNNV